jgi:DNA-directed RNA polymerase specialized sigma24 family protein
MSAHDPPGPPAPPGAGAAGVDRLFERYAHRLVALAAARLDARLRAKVDAEDVVMSVFRTLCRRAAAGEFLTAEEGGLWALLVRITLCKCHQQGDHFFAARRDVRREAAPADPSGSGPGPPEACSAEPTPDEAAALLDVIERLRDGLGSDRKRQVLDLTLQGYSVAEISHRVGYYERGVERARAEARRRLQQMLE